MNALKVGFKWGSGYQDGTCRRCACVLARLWEHTINFFLHMDKKKKKEVLFGVKKVILVRAPVRTHAHLVSLETPPAVCDQLWTQPSPHIWPWKLPHISTGRKAALGHKSRIKYVKKCSGCMSDFTNVSGFVPQSSFIAEVTAVSCL